MSTVLLLLLVVVAAAVQQACCLVRLDLTQLAWQLSNSNRSISVPTRLPAHVLGILSAAGIVQQDPLYRFGELETRWVAEDTWNFTLIWPGQQHAQVAECKHVLLVLHGVDTFGSVVVNGRHVLATNNAHRSWWLPLPAKSILRDGANMLSVVIQPAAAAALRAKALNPYAIPTMKVPGGFDVYNFARKPAADFGWDWGPAFIPAGITGGIEMIGFNRAALIGAMVDQQMVNSSTFLLTATAQFLVPEAEGDTGQLTVSLPSLQLKRSETVWLKAGVVAGNALQALATIQIAVPANRVTLWMPVGRLPQGQRPALYDLQLAFQPQAQPSSKNKPAHETSSVARRIGFRKVELVQQPIRQAAAELIPENSSSSSSSSSGNDTDFVAAVGPDRPGQGVTTASTNSAGVTRGTGVTSDTPTSDTSAAGDARSSAAVTTNTTLLSQQQQQQQDRKEDEGESFYFTVNGVPLYAKGANLIPLHVLSTAVTDDAIVRLLQSAAAANMNMIRIWGGGLYQRDILYDTADELGLLVWQEAMFACSPYPRDPAFLSNVESEVIQQLLRLGSHPSIALWGGNNEIEASFEWYNETRGNLALFAVDYQALFVDTIGTVVQQMLPGVPWVDSSPSNGYLNLGQLPSDQISQDLDSRDADQANPNIGSADHSAAAAATATLKRWGNPQDPKFGDVHFYNYKDDCQDWRTYPAARFVSEYGWQSYPSWATYKAATSAQDRVVDCEMTECRQRHPNGTVELLAQLQRRFKLPQTWLQLLPQPTTAATAPTGALAASTWGSICTLTLEKLSLLWDTVSRISRWWQAVCSARRKPTANPEQQQQQQWIATGSSSSSSSGSDAADMQHYIYLTQLQQMLCYDTSLSYWRRLRSNSSALTMGVLYWQLNDIWPGASWSSINYGGVWKPLHYGVTRSFAELSLSVQHDLHNGTLQIHIVSDLSHSAQVDLTIRLLSLEDTAEMCSNSSSSGSSSESSSYSRILQQQQDQQQGRGSTETLQQQQQQQQQSAICASTPWSKYCHVRALTVPPASAVRSWSSTVQQLLSAAAGCTRQSCYIHIALTAAAAAAVTPQNDVGKSAPWLDQPLLTEATVFIAPFSQMDLPEPNLQLSHFKFLNDSVEREERGGTTDSTGSPITRSTRQGSTQTSEGSIASQIAADHAAAVQAEHDILQAQHQSETRPRFLSNTAGVVQFTVSSSRVAVYAVWELQDQQANSMLPGHFSDNAVTVHPCEPRTVRFIPSLGTANIGEYLWKVQQQQEVRQLQQRAGQDEVQQQQQQRQVPYEVQQYSAGKADVAGSTSSTHGASDGGQRLAAVLQRSVVASSLYDHQQFAPPTSRSTFNFRKR